MEEMKKKKKQFSLLNVLIGVFIVFFLIYLFIPCGCPTKEDAYRIICGSKLRQFINRFHAYQSENSQIPLSSQWCDSIKPFFDEEDMNEAFQCTSDPNGPCSYAMNENIPADANELPGDLVLLFESKPGWNRIGGPDDVITDRHEKKNKPGANVAFADGHVEFVEAKEIPNLRWKIEE